MEIAATTFSFSCQSFCSLCSKVFMQTTLNRSNDQWWHLLQGKKICEVNNCIKTYLSFRKCGKGRKTEENCYKLKRPCNTGQQVNR